ncbi:MAG: MGMT family protein [Candidatus Dormibacterales bacterium]
MRGPSFPEAVATVVSALGRGELASYGQIAARAGRPGAARAVGSVLAGSQNLPWWRVVRADGRLAAPGPALQARLLRAEGIIVRWGRVSDPGTVARLRPGALEGEP